MQSLRFGRLSYKRRQSLDFSGLRIGSREVKIDCGSELYGT